VVVVVVVVVVVDVVVVVVVVVVVGVVVSVGVGAISRLESDLACLTVGGPPVRARRRTVPFGA
jgi:hypothetical protein